MEHFEVIKASLQFIDRNLGSPISIDMLAARYHFSPFYYHRLFTLIVGKPVGAYIRERRLEKARELLWDKSRTVTSVCMSLGFDSSPSFSRTFRAAYGLTPSAYRKKGIIKSPYLWKN